MNRRILLAAILSLWASAATSADAPPAIRQFDIATTEKLGRAMYEQDKEAWRATDILLAAHPQDELSAQKMNGWIVVSRPEEDVVRFVHDGPNGAELFYDVTFPKAGEPALSMPENRTLAGEERAMYDARTLALSNSDHNCSDAYNTVVLKDPEQDGWLVWVMAATKKDRDAIILGGHSRFSVSKDGKTIRQKDALSRNSQRYDRAKSPNGGEAELLTTEVVSLIPVETYVFASLSYKIKLRVGTGDGKAWKIDGDTIGNIDMDMPGIDGFAARTLASYDETCMAIVKRSADQKYYNVPEKGIIPATEHDERFVPDKPATGDVVVSFTCGRADLVPAPNDYKVLRAGYSLFISDTGVGHVKNLSVLELSNGQMQFRNVKGTPPAPDVLARLQKRLDQLQVSLRN